MTVDDIVQQLPTPLLASVPYAVLFGILGLVAALLWRASQDAQKEQLLRETTKRRQRLAADKWAFVDIALRFAQTAFAGQPNSAIATVANELQQAATRALAAGTLPAVPAKVIVPAKAIWRRRRFWVPLTTAAVSMLICNTLLIMQGDDIVVTVVAQLSLFVALAIGLHISLRASRVEAKESADAKQLHDQQAALDDQGNSAIRQAAEELSQKLGGTQAPAITTALKQLADVANVEAPAANRPFDSFRFSVLVAKGQSVVIDEAYKRQVRIIPSVLDDVTLASQQPERVVQMLTVLLANAVAHSKENSQVDVEIRVYGNMAALTVADHGDGLKPEAVADLARPLTEVQGSVPGLSIYMTKLLTNNLGGQFLIKSSLGHGTSVTVGFPIR